MMTCLVALAIVVAIVLEYRFDRVRRARFKERFPPIDDQEFIRRCGPDIQPEVAIRVRRIVSEQLGIEYNRIYPEQSFVNDLDCC